MKQTEIAATIREILKETELSKRAGVHEAMQRFDWFTRIGRKKLAELLASLER